MRKSRKCPQCGLTMRLSMLPWVGLKWCHAPGDRARHDRAVAAADRRAEEEAFRAARREAGADETMELNK